MKKILVPTAGAMTAKASAEYAISVAKVVEAELHVLHVVREDDDDDKIDESLSVFRAAAAAAGVPLTGSVGTGKVVDQIIEYAEQNGVSLVLMGASNGLVVERWLSYDVMGQTMIPVLVMPYQILSGDE